MAATCARQTPACGGTRSAPRRCAQAATASQSTKFGCPAAAKPPAFTRAQVAAIAPRGGSMAATCARSNAGVRRNSLRAKALRSSSHRKSEHEVWLSCGSQTAGVYSERRLPPLPREAGQWRQPALGANAGVRRNSLRAKALRSSSHRKSEHEVWLSCGSQTAGVYSERSCRHCPARRVNGGNLRSEQTPACGETPSAPRRSGQTDAASQSTKFGCPAAAKPPPFTAIAGCRHCPAKRVNGGNLRSQ